MSRGNEREHDVDYDHTYHYCVVIIAVSCCRIPNVLSARPSPPINEATSARPVSAVRPPTDAKRRLGDGAGPDRPPTHRCHQFVVVASVLTTLCICLFDVWFCNKFNLFILFNFTRGDARSSARPGDDA
jgi:hypothetical protein